MNASPENTLNASPDSSNKAKNLSAVEEKALVGEDQPPIRIDSALHLAWGLTLGLSPDNVQTALVTEIKTRYLKDLSYNGHNARYYIENLGTYIASYLRSMGFEKSIYDHYTKMQQELLKRKIEDINGMANFSSFSKEGIVAKVSAFLGIGSLGELVRRGWFESQISRDLTGAISELASEIRENPSAAPELSDSISSLARAANEVRNLEALPIEIGVILVSGLAGLVVVTAVLKFIRSRVIRRYIKETYDKQQAYWETVARPIYIANLVHLCSDIKELAKERYPNYTESVMEGDKQVYTVVESIVPSEVLYVKRKFVFRWTNNPAHDKKLLSNGKPILLSNGQQTALKNYLIHEFSYYWINNCSFKKTIDINKDIEIIEAIREDKESSAGSSEVRPESENPEVVLELVNKKGLIGQKAQAHLMLDKTIVKKYKVLAQGNEGPIDIFEVDEKL